MGKKLIKNVFDGIFNMKILLASDNHSILFQYLLEMIRYFTEAYTCVHLLLKNSDKK